jgi:lipopolysaccharide transport system permease protein
MSSERSVALPSSRSAPIVLEPSHGWRSVDLAELWRYRELLFFFVWRDVKVRYKQTLLGVIWVLIRPILSVILFTLIFGKLAKMPSDGLPYPVFVLAAMIPWNFFAGALASGSNSVQSNAHLITKVYFPRIVIPTASVFSGFVDVVITFALVIVLMLWYGIVPPVEAVITVPFLFLVTIVVALGMSFWLGALNVAYRDVGNAVPFLLQIWLYATPVVYPLSRVPEKWRWIVVLNPMTGVVEAFRGALFGRPWPAIPLALTCGLGLILLITGVFYFRRVENTFADTV